MNPIRVLIVEDSAVMRKFVRDALSSCADIEVVGAAQDPLIARDMIKRLNPDVLTLDINMPNMSGLDFLERLMRLRPLPVVMFSGLTQEGSSAALQALSLGAVDFIAKPTTGDISEWNSVAADLVSKVQGAACAQLQLQAHEHQEIIDSGSATGRWPKNRIVAIGASTGGVQALRTILGSLPENCPPILVAQHMPANFTSSFVKRLNGQFGVAVVEAVDGAGISPGTVTFAPGDKIFTIERRRGEYICRVRRPAGCENHIPSIDCLLESVAFAAGRAAMGIVLTGMGRDGAKGLLMMREAGAITAVQDRHTSLIYGMPKAAMEAGAALYELPLDRVGSFILNGSRSRNTMRSDRDAIHEAS